MKKVFLINSANNEESYINCKCCCNFLTIKKLFAEKSKIDLRGLQLLNNEKWVITNNNQIVPISQDRFYYQISNARTINDIILKINENFFDIPEFIEINENSSIRELKTILFQYSSEQTNMFIFNENGNLLDDNKTIFSCNLFDDCKINVWRGNGLLVSVNIHVPFPNVPFSNVSFPNVSFPMKFSVTEKISDISNKIMEELKLGKTCKSALFTDLYYLSSDKYLVDYPLQNEGSNLYFVDLKNKQEVKQGPLVTKGKYFKIFKGEFGGNLCAEPVAICQYSMKNQIIEDKKILKYEIISRLLLCKDSRFVQLISMYDEDKYFYIITQYMDKGSVRTLYKASPLENMTILHYSIQICEALSYMHQIKLIHRTLTCSSALVDSNNNIKLTNFHLSKHLHNNLIDEILKGIPGSKIDTKKCWLAPEVLQEEIYGLKADIWSFGVTMIEMVTRNRPYSEMNVLRAIHEIIRNLGIEFDETIFPELNDVIHACLRPLANERPASGDCLRLLNDLNNNR